MPVSPQTLSSLDIFGDLNPQELEQISELIHPIKVFEGEVLTRLNAHASVFYVVISGNFMLSFTEDRALTLHNTGDIMGWSTVVSPYYYRGTAVALTDGEVLSLPGDEFFRLLQINTALGDKIMKKIDRVAKERMALMNGFESVENH